jgi:hypothetical protein
VFAVVMTACSDPATPQADGGTSTSAAHKDEATTTTAAGSTPAPASAPGVPVAGDCIEPVTPDSAGGPQLPALVPCDDPHGGEIVAVSTLSDGPDAAYPAVTELTDAASDARAACQGTGEGTSEFDEFVGDNRLESPAAAGSKAGTHPAWIVSSLEAVLFVPGPAAWSKGERWAACAAVLRNSSGALAEYQGSAKGLRSPGKLTEAFAWCRTDEDQTGNYSVVGCDQPHSLEQVASFSVGDDTEAYPGNDPIDVLAGELCPGLASAATAKRSDSASTTKFGLSWTFPREDDWSNGDRTGRCYMRSLEEPTTGSFAAGTV